MDKSLLMGVVLGVGGAMAGGALAGYAVWNTEKQAPAPAAQAQPLQGPTLIETPASAAAPVAGYGVATSGAMLNAVQPLAGPQFAEVIDVDPVTETRRYPKQQCRYEKVVHREPVKDEHRVAGTVLGGALGGVLGRQVGKGRGRDVATVAGVIAGGYAGNRIQKNLQQSRTYTTSERRCSTVTATRKKTVGYDVTYRWNGRVDTVRMNQRPGDRLPVENGHVQRVSAKQLALYD